MLTLFAAAPIVPFEILDVDGQVERTVDAPASPAQWEKQREGETGWWTLYAPLPPGAPDGAPPRSRFNRVMLFDTATIGFQRFGASPVLGIFMAHVQARFAFRALRPLLNNVPWWATVAEIRDPAAAVSSGRRNAKWNNRTTAVRNAWVDLRQATDDPSDPTPFRPFVSLAGLNAIGQADATDADDVISGSDTD